MPTPPTQPLAKLLGDLAGMMKGGQFAPFIDFIVFPKYRRMASMERIDFDFPLTVLVGKNGSGKSSLLHALAGAPEGTSVEPYWFSTAVDPLDDSTDGRGSLSESERARFWYGYRDKGVIRQAIKQRVRNKGNPDYWEPSRLAKKYGMDASQLGPKENRHPQISMSAEYLSLRMHLSAFDRCFYFASSRLLSDFAKSGYWQKTGSVDARRKKVHPRDYIRHRAKNLSEALCSDEPYKLGGSLFADPPRLLPLSVLGPVSKIVGKVYTEGSVIRHRLYETWGDSIQFRTGGSTYTEANAGSGETAVVRIVTLFEEAKPNTLLLIDEPETSLHPGAQVELLTYMLGKVKEKRLQVVISTHAPAFVRLLPPAAIKVLFSGQDGFVRVRQNVTPEDAFHEIGHEFDPTCNIVVEDRLAKAVLDAVSVAEGGALAKKLRVGYGPGGVAVMKQDIAVYMKDAVVRPVLIFDGDQERDHANVRQMSGSQMTPAVLDRIIATQAGVEVRLDQDSNASEDVKVAARKSYLEYFRTHVLYLPFPSPEQELWSDDAAKTLLDAAGLERGEAEALLAKLGSTADYKKRFADLSAAAGDMHP